MDIPHVASSLNEATDALQKDHEFLLAGDVFSKEFIQAHIKLCKADIAYLRTQVHPAEFEMYYST